MANAAPPVPKPFSSPLAYNRSVSPLFPAKVGRPTKPLAMPPVRSISQQQARPVTRLTSSPPTYASGCSISVSVHSDSGFSYQAGRMDRAVTPPRRSNVIASSSHLQQSDWLSVAAESLSANKEALQQRLRSISNADVDRLAVKRNEDAAPDFTKDSALDKFKHAPSSLDLEAIASELFTRLSASEQRQQDRFGAIESDIDALKNNFLSAVATTQCDVVDVVQNALAEQRQLRSDVQEKHNDFARMQAVMERQDRILAQMSGLQSLARQEQSLSEMCADQVKIGEERLRALFAKLDALKEYTAVAEKAEVVFHSRLSEDTDLHEFQNLVQDLRGICMPDDGKSTVNDIQQCARLLEDVELSASKLYGNSDDSKSGPQGTGLKCAAQLVEPTMVDSKATARFGEFDQPTQFGSLSPLFRLSSKTL